MAQMVWGYHLYAGDHTPGLAGHTSPATAARSSVTPDEICSACRSCGTLWPDACHTPVGLAHELGHGHTDGLVWCGTPARSDSQKQRTGRLFPDHPLQP